MRLPELTMSWFSWPLSLAVLAVGLVPSAQAGDWDFRHRTAVGLTAVDRTGEGAQNGMVLQAIPQIFLTGEGGRVKADINYRLTASAGSDGVDPKSFAHDGYARVRGEVVDDFFWLGANATAGLTGGSAGSGPIDAINFNTDGGRQYYTVAVNPEFRQHLNRYAEIYSLNSFSYVNSDTENSSSNDSTKMTLNLGVRNGRYFSQFGWALNATYNKTDYSDYSQTRSLIDATLRRRLNANWAVFGRVGYEDNDVQTNVSNPNGAIWSVGGTWNPSPRTRVSADYGSRYFGNQYSANISHTTKRTTLSAGVSRNIDNRRTSQLLDSYYFLLDGNGNPILDPNTGNPIVANIPQVEQINEDYVNTQFRGAVTVVGKRTQVTLTGTVSNQDYEVSPINNDWYSASLRISRQLGSGYNASLGGNVRRSENDNNGVKSNSDTYSANFLLSKNLSPVTTVALDLLYRDYNNSNTDQSYTENRIGIWYRTTFL